MPHCSNHLIGLHRPGRESSLFQPVDASSQSLLSVTGLVTQNQDTHSTSTLPDSNSFAASHDSPQSDEVGLEPSTHPGMSTAPFKKEVYLSSPECLFQASLLDTLQRNGASLKCHDDIIDIINDGLRRGTLRTKHSPLKSGKSFISLTEKVFETTTMK